MLKVKKTSIFQLITKSNEIFIAISDKTRVQNILPPSFEVQRRSKNDFKRIEKN